MVQLESKRAYVWGIVVHDVDLYRPGHGFSVGFLCSAIAIEGEYRKR